MASLRTQKPAAKPDSATKVTDPELSPDDAADNSDAPPVIRPEQERALAERPP